MSTIRILPDQVANRIAAGEVIERPVAVVKELVDNSIDAGATRIKIQFKQGGKSYVLVDDNGKGMAPDDALLSLERHATSKIQSSDDLFNIQTLGFRGEAIPSIASVSRFLMRTRPEAQMQGTEILVNGGKLIHRKDIGMPPGTRIEVTHLFSSIPARRKFLKTDNTEASHIIQWIRLMAMAHPHVAFRLLSNDRTLLALPEHNEPFDRVLSLWGREMEHQMVPIQFEGEGLEASGFIGKTGVSRPSRQDIVTIVNGRPVESRTLGFAITEAYHTYIPKGRYPAVYLNINIDPSMVDVNIHPSKKEIKFKNESKIRTLVIQSIWEVLRSKELRGSHPQTESTTPLNTQSIKGRSSSNTIPATTVKGGNPVNASSPSNPIVSKDPIKTIPQPAETSVSSLKSADIPPSHAGAAGIPQPTLTSRPSPNILHSKTSPSNQNRQQTPTSKEANVADLLREWRFIGDYHRSYSLFERPSGLALVHNSRALRRIGYEKVLTNLKKGEAGSQQEIVPTTFELDAQMSAKLKKWGPKLVSCNIVVEEFGRNFFRLEATPSMLEGSEVVQMIEDWLHRDAEHTPNQTTLFQEVALACASKYRQQLELPLRKEIALDVLCQLLRCEQPMVDPEGSPVIHMIRHRVFEDFKSLEKL